MHRFGGKAPVKSHGDLPTDKCVLGDHCVPGDIVDLLLDPAVQIPEAEVVIGGPPCQGFSLLDKFRDDDHRNQLWRPFMEIVQRSGASVFVMENVPQLIGSVEHQMIMETARSLEFKTASARLCAADYGVPQTRWRAFIIGCRFTDPQSVFPPKKTNYPTDLNQRRIFAETEVPYRSNPKPYRTVLLLIAKQPGYGPSLMHSGSPCLGPKWPSRSETQSRLFVYALLLAEKGIEWRTFSQKSSAAG
jgi:site-specific DNA-cytosine methylase